MGVAVGVVLGGGGTSLKVAKGEASAPRAK